MSMCILKIVETSMLQDCGNFHVTIKRLKPSSTSYSDPVLSHWWGWISHTEQHQGSLLYKFV